MRQPHWQNLRDLRPLIGVSFGIQTRTNFAPPPFVPRRSLLHVPGLSVHVFPRGINGAVIVGDEWDRERLLRCIIKATQRDGVEINAFALMTTHYHLIVTPPAHGALAKSFQTIGGRHTRYFNRKYRRIGPLWNERYPAALLHDERYWYNCLRYVDLNPFRAHVVSAPEESSWSSYRFHAFGEPCDFLTPHPLYIRLGTTDKARQQTYREMCDTALTDEEIEEQRHPRLSPVLPLTVAATV